MHGKTWRSIQDKFYHSKTSSCFPNFDASNTWQMGHNSQEGIFLGQELLLDFAAWLELTSNADNTITVYQLPSKFQNPFWFFKMCWWLTGLSKLHDASQPPGRLTRYFNTIRKILVDGALMWHISFLFDGISFDTRSIHVLCSRHNNWCNQSVPRFPLYILFSFDFKQLRFSGIPYKQSTWLLFNKIIRRFLLFFVQQKICDRSRGVNIASCDELLDQSECPILAFTSGNYTK